ncbi:MAG: hypothetical protein HY329_00405, partial [Chloroflexi bacterium]|nr:hypothetical protein [Chloroflexota bacterium]
MDTKTRRMSLVLEPPATVLVSVGQPITAGTVVARGQLLDAPMVLPLSQALQSSPAEAVGLLTKKVGDPVQLNEVIATRAAFLATKTVRSPIAGIVLGIDFTRGEVALLSTGEPSELRTPVAGTVVEVKPGRGITLEYAAAELAGVGLGAPASGRITIVSDAA